MDFEPCLKVHSLTSVEHKGIKLGQMIHLNVSFHVAVSIIDWLKLETRPSSLCDLEMTNKYFSMNSNPELDRLTLNTKLLLIRFLK